MRATRSRPLQGVDGALTQISREIQGNVVFSSRRQTASSAAAAVAKQTGTVWHAYYGFYKRGEEPARLKGDVVDHDINGNPVTALPLVSFRNTISTPAPISGVQIGGNTLALGGPSVTSVSDIGVPVVPDFGSPFGYGSPYGYDYGNPYASNGFGYTTPNGGVAFPGFDYTPGSGDYARRPRRERSGPASSGRDRDFRAEYRRPARLPHYGRRGWDDRRILSFNTMTQLLAASLIRDIPDFPKSGILFKDITPVLGDAAAFQEVIDRLVVQAQGLSPDLIVGVESRGFLFGAPLALALGIGFVPVRKVGKLPAETIQEEYALEYGTATVEVHRDAIRPGQRVLIVDDLLATGGTAVAAAKLVEKLGGKVAGFSFLIELEFLAGRQVLSGYDVHSLLTY